MIYVFSCYTRRCKDFLIWLNVFNITFESKPCFHAEANFGDISADKMYKKATLLGLLS